MPADVIDYEIFGTEMQYVEITLDPGEMVIAEAGGMMYMTSGIQMETVFGDPSAQQTGFMGKFMSAGKRLLTGESLFMTTFTNAGAGREKVAFASPYPGKIIPMHLDELGGELICQKDSFLCAARGVQIGIAFQKKIGVGLFGGEGFIMQRLTGDGIAMIHAGGTLLPLQLSARRDAPGRHRLPRGAHAQRALRHPVRGRHQEHALRRRGTVLRHAHRAGQRVAAVAAVLAPGRPHSGACSARRRQGEGRRLHPRRVGRPAGWR